MKNAVWWDAKTKSGKTRREICERLKSNTKSLGKLGVDAREIIEEVGSEWKLEMMRYIGSNINWHGLGQYRGDSPGFTYRVHKDFYPPASKICMRDGCNLNTGKNVCKAPLDYKCYTQLVENRPKQNDGKCHRQSCRYYYTSFHENCGAPADIKFGRVPGCPAQAEYDQRNHKVEFMVTKNKIDKSVEPEVNHPNEKRESMKLHRPSDVRKKMAAALQDHNAQESAWIVVYQECLRLGMGKIDQETYNRNFTGIEKVVAFIRHLAKQKEK